MSVFYSCIHRLNVIYYNLQKLRLSSSFEEKEVSGPKIDQAEVERRRKAELERLRQEKLQKIHISTEKLNMEIYKTQLQIDYIDKHLASLVRNLKTAEEMEITLSKLNALKSIYIDKLNNVLEINVPAEPDGIFACTFELAYATQAIIADYNNEVKLLENRINDFINQLNGNNEITGLSKKFSTGIEKRRDIEDFNFTAELDNIALSDIEQSVKEKAEQLLSEIETLVNSEAIQESDLKELLAIANNIYTQAFEAKSLFEAAVVEYDVAKPRIARNISIFEDIYQDYYAEYIVWLDLINKNRTVPLDIFPKKQYQFTTIEELQNETALLIKESKTLNEKHFIIDQINEVMGLFDYNITEEIVFDYTQIGNHYISENKAGHAAIHMYISGENRIMMEVVGTERNVTTSKNDTVNAKITDSSNLSIQKKDHLLNEQGRFCELHPKIVEELGKRGIIFNMQKRNEPDMIHCKEITYSSTESDMLSNKSMLYNPHAGKRSGGKRSKLRERVIKV